MVAFVRKKITKEYIKFLKNAGFTHILINSPCSVEEKYYDLIRKYGMKTISVVPDWLYITSIYNMCEIRNSLRIQPSDIGYIKFISPWCDTCWECILNDRTIARVIYMSDIVIPTPGRGDAIFPFLPQYSHKMQYKLNLSPWCFDWAATKNYKIVFHSYPPKLIECDEQGEPIIEEHFYDWYVSAPFSRIYEIIKISKEINKDIKFWFWVAPNNNKTVENIVAGLYKNIDKTVAIGKRVGDYCLVMPCLWGVNNHHKASYVSLVSSWIEAGEKIIIGAEANESKDKTIKHIRLFGYYSSMIGAEDILVGDNYLQYFSPEELRFAFNVFWRQSKRLPSSRSNSTHMARVWAYLH